MSTVSDPARAYTTPADSADDSLSSGARALAQPQRRRRKRRAQGDGALFVRDKGTKRERWVARMILPSGKKKEFHAKTQAEARRKFEDAKQARDKGLLVSSDRQSVAQFALHWLENTARKKVRPRTFAGYQTIIKVYVVPHLGHLQLTKLTAQHIQAWQNELLSTPTRRGGTLSSGTVTNARRVLGKALEQAVRWDLIARNPVRLTDGVQVKRTEVEPLSPDQARTLLAAIRGDRLEALYTVALALGLRRGEALGLKWEDISFDTSTLLVRRALQRADGELQITDVKTPKSRRAISLPVVAVRALQQHRRRQETERGHAADLWQESGLVFTTPLGAPLDPDGATKGFQRILKRAGLPHQRFHDLRHACASLLLAQGLDLKVIQDILGHSTITITANLYAHVLMGLKRQAASHMDAMLGSVDNDDAHPPFGARA